ncbi:MAG: hypothetical protein FWC64_05490 [Treponema sp.]|nr:hypothetical protein [Treponema sp.]
MKTGLKVFLPLFICAVFPLSLFAESREGENALRARQALGELGIPFQTRSFPGGYDGPGTSLVVRVDAADGSPGTFVLAVPLWADFAVDTGIAFAGTIHGQNTDLTVIVAFLGSEESGPQGQAGISHAGLRDLLTLVDIPENWALCYLDIAQAPESLLLRHGTEGYVAPLELLRPLSSLLRSGGVPWSFRVWFNELYKLRLVEGHPALSITWEREVNSFVLASGPSAPTGPVSPHEMAGLLAGYAGLLSFPMLMVDRHYFFFRGPGGEPVFLGQGIAVALLLVTAGVCLILLLLYSVKYNVVLLFHFRLFFKSIWIFFLLLGLLIVSIRISGVLYSVIFRVFGPSAPAVLPVHVYYTGAALVLVLAVLIFFLHSPVFALIRLPKRAQFYGFSSVALATAGLFIAAFLDFSFIPAFLWAFFFVFFAASLSKPAPVFLCILCIPLFAIAALLNIFQTGSVMIAELFIPAHWRAPVNWPPAIQIALFSLPPILLVKRWVLLNRGPAFVLPKPGRRGKRRLIRVCALMAVVLAAMLAQALLASGAGL